MGNDENNIKNIIPDELGSDYLKNINLDMMNGMHQRKKI
jgi:hypothetical protein